MLESLTKNFVFFYWHNTLKKLYKKRMGKINPSTNIFLATIAGALSLIFTAPMDLVTTNLQTSQMTLKEIIISIAHQEGFRGFYKGFGLSLILCSNPAITNTTFDFFKQLLQMVKSGELENEQLIASQSDHQIVPLTAMQSFFLGAFAKAVATIITYPYIRTKVFVQARVLKSQQKCEEIKNEERKNENEVTELNEQNNNNLIFNENNTMQSLNEKNNLSYPMFTANYLKHINKNYNHITNNNHRSNNFLTRGSNNYNGLDNNSIYNYAHHFKNIKNTKRKNMNMQNSEGYEIIENYPSPATLLANIELLKPASFCLSDMNESLPYMVEEISKDSKESKPLNRPIRRSDSYYSESDKGFVGIFVSTVMQEGVSGLYRGLKLQLIKTVVASAILYMIKEKLRYFVIKLLRFLVSLFKRKRKKISNSSAIYI